MKKKFIIIYSECLRSKIIYQNFLIKNSKNIKAIIEIPNYPNKDFNIGFSRKLFFSSFRYLLFQIFQTKLYNLVSYFYKSSLKHLAKSKKINFIKTNNLPNLSFLKSKVKKFSDKDLIFCSTMHILRDEQLNLKNILLNFHEAPLPKFRGSSLYYHLIAQGEKNFQTNILQPINKIDLGKVEITSKSYDISKLNVFKLLLLGYLINSNLIFKLLKKKIVKINKKKYIFPKFFKAYSLPTYSLEKKIKILKKEIKLKDYLFLLKISFLKNTDLYSAIKKYINNNELK